MTLIWKYTNRDPWFRTYLWLLWDPVQDSGLGLVLSDMVGGGLLLVPLLSGANTHYGLVVHEDPGLLLVLV